MKVFIYKKKNCEKNVLTKKKNRLARPYRANQFRMEKDDGPDGNDDVNDNIDNLVAKQSRADHTRRQARVPETESTITTSHNKTETRPQAETRTTLINSKEQQSRTRMKRANQFRMEKTNDGPDSDE